jgi:Cys-rich protein (TIGR01571 family)
MAEKTWTHGKFACMDDPAVCVKTYFCPCLTVMDISEFVEPGSGVKNCLMWICCLECCCLSIFMVDQPLRAKVAEKAGISIANSDNGLCCTMLCCERCAKCQTMNEVNELKKAANGAPEQQVMGAPEMIEMA